MKIEIYTVGVSILLSGLITYYAHTYFVSETQNKELIETVKESVVEVDNKINKQYIILNNLHENFDKLLDDSQHQLSNGNNFKNSLQEIKESLNVISLNFIKLNNNNLEQNDNINSFKIDYNRMTIKELKQIALDNEIYLPSKTKKADVIKALCN